MNVLLTGRTGFIGKVVEKQLICLGFKVYSLEDLCNLKRVDITSEFNFMSFVDIDIVVHVAGYINPDGLVEGNEHFNNVNFRGSKNLCNALDNVGFKPKVFIFLSSVAVYGTPNCEFISEENPRLGKSPYALSKILAEDFLKDWSEVSKVDLVVLRLPLVVGMNPNGNLKKMINAIKNNYYFRISNNKARKSVIWVEDIASVIPLLINHPGIYNLTDSMHPTLWEIEEVFAKILKKRIWTLPHYLAVFLAKIGDILPVRFPLNSKKLEKLERTLIFDNSKIINTINWWPKDVIDEVCQCTF